MRKVMTDLDKLECTEYTLDILEDALRTTPTVNEDWVADMADLIRIAKEEVDRRRGQYLEVSYE